MTSIFERALGAEFRRLHPELQRRFGFGRSDGTACIGMGVMDGIRRGPAYTVPFLALGATRHILLPGQGRRVRSPSRTTPTSTSTGGRPSPSCAPSSSPRPPPPLRRHDGLRRERGRVLDFLGTHQHLAVELRDARRRRRRPAHPHRRAAGRRGVLDVRLPAPCQRYAEVHEWFDDRTRRFRIDVRVTNRHFGPVFGYRGSFVVTDTSTPARRAVPRRRAAAARGGSRPDRAESR